MTIIDFSFLGIKPMEDVILHHPDWEIHCPNSTMQRLESLDVVKYQDWMGVELVIEAIPERLTGDEITNERADMIDGYRESFPECFKIPTPEQAGFG